MTLASAIDTYVRLKQSLGAVFSGDGRILAAFVRAVGDVSVSTITPEMCTAFCRGHGAPTRCWSRKHEALRGLFRYLVGRGHLHHSPLPEPGPRIQSTFQRYIYTHDDVVRLITAAAQPVPPATLIQPQTLRLVVLVLYATGLRAGEALRLRDCDVDLRDRLLTIWESKFFKSRLVPVGTELCRALSQYQTDRARLPRAEGDRSVFFATRRGRAISLGRLEHAFTRLLRQTHVGQGATGHRPRPHDLRATFAVHRLIAWYREGADVQARLPLLSTYLGHVNVSATSVYLTMTAELLVEASLRFERYALPAQEAAQG
ncbi:MAG: tyrosine-type recombinase/integrase [Acidobacteria bacterium]|nr:tyrosine-type recombinase/integrase [Acidobacteriota bacterium]